jgi:hypothetical protein
MENLNGDPGDTVSSVHFIMTHVFQQQSKLVAVLPNLVMNQLILSIPLGFASVFFIASKTWTLNDDANPLQNSSCDPTASHSDNFSRLYG